MIKCTDQNITLPDGTLIMEGESFRNNFHLKQDIEADFFVPCGGRPEYCWLLFKYINFKEPSIFLMLNKCLNKALTKRINNQDLNILLKV